MGTTKRATYTETKSWVEAWLTVWPEWGYRRLWHFAHASGYRMGQKRILRAKREILDSK